jgi:hypothetical protein
MTSQILSLNLPTCRTAIRKKTAARTMIAIYVDEHFRVPADEPWHPGVKRFRSAKRSASLVQEDGFTALLPSGCG